jgi:hypothetical protein
MRLAAMMLVILTTSSVVQSQQQPAGKINGRVLDQLGNPLAEASILVSAKGLDDRHLVTDQKGVYEIEGVRPGSYSISASFRGFHNATRTVYVGPDGQVTVELGLRLGRLAPSQGEAIIMGTVRLSDGSQAGGATVTIISAFNDEIREQHFVSSMGSFEFRLAEPGQYLIYAAKPGFVVNVSNVTVPPKFTKEPLIADFELRRLE